MNIVLVHGFISTGKIFFYIKRKLEAQGHRCFTPTLKPIDAKYGIEDLAIKLKDKIESNLEPDSKFVLVGFSMGGIICRYYLQELGGIERVNKLFTISSPHHGSYLSYIYPGKGMKQLRPKSTFLKNLKKKEFLLNTIKAYSYRTPFDLMIIPNDSSIWEAAINKKFISIMHSSMLINSKLTREIINQL
ncbi:MAG: alpha/beta fold hydrolase [Ignavibacteriaceae bacterium]|nr:alpha/beta fold hydrolase [Ignavibacteriaceae bacterium]HRN27998.1 alpha/beta fold hydrolase [Ignavibacteriaceae bacterium]HRP92566.1 alpha/beta fold hydrolase [Ignavibacteriaceae bacterium]HRQ55686.1 alpha/beta fold hydrolase [Ignavibacteriaceae bacterium]